MEYEKKYKEALKRASHIKGYKTLTPQEAAEYIFPELRESEDEKIREELISYLHAVIKEVGELGHPKIDRWISYLEKQKEQKPAEKQDYSGLNDLERAILRGFLAAGVENVPVTIIKETAKECLAQIKPAEWSEEDKDYYDTIVRKLEVIGDDSGLSNNQIKFLREHCPSHRSEWSEEDETRLTNTLIMLKEYAIRHYSKDDVEKSVDWLENRFKSLRPQPQGTYKLIVHNIYEMLKDKDFFDITPSHRVSLLNDIRVRCKNADEQAEILDVPSWKPSKEQMKGLKFFLDFHRPQRNAGTTNWQEYDAVESLYNQLKKL